MKPNELEFWPFDQPPNCATFTMRQVLEGLEPIVVVYHDDEDHGWQFIGCTDASMTDVKIVSLGEIVQVDPTVLGVADLPPRWKATRTHVGGPWRRCEHRPFADDDR
jgi:hypothetical protein